MATNLPLMPDDLILDLEAALDHPYYKEIKQFFSTAFVMEMTARTLMIVSTRNADIHKAIICAVEDCIADLSELSFTLREELQSNTIYDPD